MPVRKVWDEIEPRLLGATAFGYSRLRSTERLDMHFTPKLVHAEARGSASAKDISHIDATVGHPARGRFA